MVMNKEQRRACQLTALNAIAAAVSQSRELEHIIQVALAETMRALGVEFGWIHLLEGDRLILKCHAGLSEEFVSQIRELDLEPWTTQKTLDRERLDEEPRKIREQKKREGIQSWLSVPLQSKSELIGCLALANRDPDRFEASEVQFIETVSHQLSVAVENARLLALAQGQDNRLTRAYQQAERYAKDLKQISEQERKQSLQLDALNAVIAAVSGSLDLNTVLKETLDKVIEMMKVESQDVQLLISIGSQLGVAIENAKLYEETQRRLQELAFLNEASHTVNSSLDLEQVLTTVMREATNVLKVEATSVLLLDDEELVLETVVGPQAEKAKGLRFPLGQGIAGWAAREGRPLLVPDVKKEPRFYPGIDEAIGFVTRSVLAVPLKVKGKVIGVIEAVNKTEGDFGQADMTLLSSMAQSAAVAIENARLYEAIEEYSRTLEEKVVLRTRNLAEEKSKLDAILHNIADGLLVVDTKDRLILANLVAARMLGFKPEEAIGHKIDEEVLGPLLKGFISDLIHQPDPALPITLEIPDFTLIGPVRKSASEKTGDWLQFDCPFYNNLPRLSIEARASTVEDERGQVLGTVIVMRDITALKEMDKLKTLFVSNVSHELRTPITIIKLTVSNFLQYYARLDNEKKIELLGTVKRQADILHRLIENILTLSRLDVGKAFLEKVEFDLSAFCRTLLSEFALAAAEKDISLIDDGLQEGTTVWADQERTGQVVRNLLSNAIKFTSAGGKVMISVRWREGDKGLVEMRVSDTGSGISPHDQAHLFERFYRGEAAARDIPGTGLGLAIVKEIVEEHGGSVSVESELGVGSTFTVLLPGKRSENGLWPS